MLVKSDKSFFPKKESGIFLNFSANVTLRTPLSTYVTLTRQSNGTYTLTLPIQQVSKMGVTGYLSGLTIGDVTYTGTVSGDVAKGTGVLTIKNMPASVLTGSDVNKALTVTCNIQMDLSVLGEINTSARMCIWNK